MHHKHLMKLFYELYYRHHIDMLEVHKETKEFPRCCLNIGREDEDSTHLNWNLLQECQSSILHFLLKLFMLKD